MASDPNELLLNNCDEKMYEEAKGFPVTSRYIDMFIHKLGWDGKLITNDLHIAHQKEIIEKLNKCNEKDNMVYKRTFNNIYSKIEMISYRPYMAKETNPITSMLINRFFTLYNYILVNHKEVNVDVETDKGIILYAYNQINFNEMPKEEKESLYNIIIELDKRGGNKFFNNEWFDELKRIRKKYNLPLPLRDIEYRLRGNIPPIINIESNTEIRKKDTEILGKLKQVFEIYMGWEYFPPYCDKNKNHSQHEVDESFELNMEKVNQFLNNINININLNDMQVTIPYNMKIIDLKNLYNLDKELYIICDDSSRIRLENECTLDSHGIKNNDTIHYDNENVKNKYIKKYINYKKKYLALKSVIGIN